MATPARRLFTPYPDDSGACLAPEADACRPEWEALVDEVLGDEALDARALHMALEAASGDVAGSVDAGAVTCRLLLREETAQAILGCLPGLADIAHRRLFVHSLVGQSVHTSVDQCGRPRTLITISAPLLALFQGMGRKQRSRMYKGLPFLEAHQGIVSGFDWTGWEWRKPTKNYPRQIERSGVSDDVRQLIEDDLRLPVQDAGPLVDFGGYTLVADRKTGRAAQGARRDRERRRTEAAAAARRSPWPLQRCLTDHLNGLPGNVLSRIVGANAPAAIGAALTIEDPERRLRTLAALREIQLVPDVVYAPSRRLRTPRVFATSVSPLGLPRDVRKALFSGCLELDLVNCQLSIAAREWDIALLADHLRREGSVWPRLIAAVAGTHGLASDEAKSALKEAVYGAVFGMSERGLRTLLSKTLSAEAAAAFLADPLVAALLVARDRALADIDADGGITDCLGHHRALTAAPGSRERKAGCRSILAGAMQAFELKLLKPVIDEAIRVSSHTRPALRIVGWLHDGLILSVSLRGVEKRLVRLVAEQAERLGVPTSLEATWLGTSGTGSSAAVRPERRRRAPRTRANGPEAPEPAGVPDCDRLDSIERETRRGGPDGDCWMWQGLRDRDGYGRARDGGRRVRAHRASWVAANGRPVPPRLVVRHTCHTPSCVNPGHLVAGTQRENVADSVAAGRTARGERNGRAVLRGGDVAEVRRMAAGGMPQAVIARMFRVHPTTVRDIVRFKIWAHPASMEATAP